MSICPAVLARDDFGDAPIYLACGVTTVVNLGGSPILLEWRKRVETGALLGPTIYTAGPFVNEPRIYTLEEVKRDIVAQAQLGYDLIKFHELPTTMTPRFTEREFDFGRIRSESPVKGSHPTLSGALLSELRSPLCAHEHP
jgi:hypothetical protein